MMGRGSVCALGAALVLAGGCCGYGGPGCGDPLLVGICGGQVGVGASSVTVSFGTDYGLSASEFGWVAARPTDVLVASPGRELGEVVLDGLAPGDARIRVGEAEGWDDDVTFDYSVKVVDEVVYAACEGEDPPALLSDRVRASLSGN